MKTLTTVRKAIIKRKLNDLWEDYRAVERNWERLNARKYSQHRMPKTWKSVKD